MYAKYRLCQLRMQRETRLLNLIVQLIVLVGSALNIHMRPYLAIYTVYSKQASKSIMNNHQQQGVSSLSLFLNSSPPSITTLQNNHRPSLFFKTVITSLPPLATSLRESFNARYPRRPQQLHRRAVSVASLGANNANSLQHRLPRVAAKDRRMRDPLQTRCQFII